LFKNNLLTENQFGFQQQNLTTVAISQLVDHIASECSNVVLAVVIFIDTIDSNIPLDKFYDMVLMAYCIKCMHSYPYNTEQWNCFFYNK